MNRYSILAPINNYFIRKDSKRQVKENSSETIRFMKESLSKDEISLIREVWDRLSFPYLMDSFKVFKSVCGFNKYFCPDELFYPLISSTLNPYPLKIAFSDKSKWPVIFSGIRQPELIVRISDGHYYDKDGQLLSEAKACDLLSQGGVIKPITESCLGKGIRFLNSSRDDFNKILEDYSFGAVIQAIVHQSKKTSILNSTSLNCFRVTTLYINGKATAPTVCLKFGKEGSRVDNVGAGGYMIGIFPDGRLYNYALDSYLEKSFATENGISFSTLIIPEVQIVIDFALSNHVKYLPDLGIVGWDIALNEENQPVMIEANIGDRLNFVGIHIEQLSTCTPIFGERTEEVIEYALNHRPRFVY